MLGWLCFVVRIFNSVVVRWRIIANLGFKFRYKFTARAHMHCALWHCESSRTWARTATRRACREEGRGHLELATAIGALVLCLFYCTFLCVYMYAIVLGQV